MACVVSIVTKCFTICWFENVNGSCTIYDFSINFRCLRENRHVKDRTKFMIFSSVTLVTNSLIVMVMFLDFPGQGTCQGHHSEPD